MDVARQTHRRITDAEKDQLLRDLLGKDYKARGDVLPVLSLVIDYVGYADTTFTLAELIPQAARFLSQRALLSIAASSASIASIVLFPVAAFIHLINAMQSGEKMYAYRAVAYRITGWAFDDGLTMSSPTIIRNIQTGFPRKSPQEVDEYRKAWAEGVGSAMLNLKKIVKESQIDERAAKLVFQALGDGNRQTLCAMILKGFESRMTPIELNVWRSNYKIRYPH